MNAFECETPHARFEPLDPIERTQELLFGLIMVLTFTGTISVAEADRVEMRHVLAAVVGCNLAWGFVDAVMHLMGAFAERARNRLAAAATSPPRLYADDFRRAAGVFLLVFLGTAPVAIPFLFVRHIRLAVRVAHGLVIVMLFGAGWSLGSHAGRSPWRTGSIMAVIGVALAAMTVGLGG